MELRDVDLTLDESLWDLMTDRPSSYNPSLGGQLQDNGNANVFRA